MAVCLALFTKKHTALSSYSMDFVFLFEVFSLSKSILFRGPFNLQCLERFMGKSRGACGPMASAPPPPKSLQKTVNLGAIPNIAIFKNGSQDYGL